MISARIKKKTARIFLFLTVISLLYQVGRTPFLPQEKQIRIFSYELIQSVFNPAFSRAAKEFGLFCFQGPGHRVMPCANAVTAPCVILIHGLDEPGLIWDKLAPALWQEGFDVLLLRYPDDQNIDVSSLFLFHCLSRVSFNQPVVLICHSMGGLVARQMLSDPDINYESAVKNGRVPVISDLIMAGTPNHGAFLARFRLFMEIREQVLLFVHGKGSWFSAFFDGTGAAAIDLLPGSKFLSCLNARPYPEGVRLHMIAGRILPLPKSLPEHFTITRGQNIQDKLAPDVSFLDFFLNQAAMIIGDGLVTLNSAVLVDVPVTVVRANHKTMLAPIFKKSTQVPPAIPVILDMLDRPGK